MSSLRVGVVCEGSHDFLCLQEICAKILTDLGQSIQSFDCLQPQVSATFQVGSGGWSQVKNWCQAISGQKYRQYIDKPLFESSDVYDFLIIHLDGDVVSLCECPPLTGLRVEDVTATEAVSALRETVFTHWLRLEPKHQDKIVMCVPVQHIEAWLASVIGPLLSSYEKVRTKDVFRSGPFATIQGRTAEKYVHAAKLAADQLPVVVAACASFGLFHTEFSHLCNLKTG